MKTDSLNKKILGVKVGLVNQKNILENIKKGLNARRVFRHVVSLNPENLVLATKHPEFQQILNEADIRINDGIGIVVAARIIYRVFVPRVTGVDLMQNLIKSLSGQSVRVLLLGGKPNLAEQLADCYNRGYPGMKFVGLAGFHDIKNPTQEEAKAVDSIVLDLMPHLMFVAFGSPEQELWIHRNRASLQGVTCIGVGGAFDFIGGKVSRAPQIVRRFGMEWLYRLVRQPWRIKRQLKLLTFLWLVLSQMIQKGG